jgi:hypothetical protein
MAFRTGDAAYQIDGANRWPHARVSRKEAAVSERAADALIVPVGFVAAAEIATPSGARKCEFCSRSPAFARCASARNLRVACQP